MNAQLKPVPMPVVRPAYDNTNLAKYWKWERDNIEALVGYYQQLGGTLPVTEDEEGLLRFARAQVFSQFSHCQWDLQRGGFL